MSNASRVFFNSRCSFGSVLLRAGVAALMLAATANAQVVISQVYGGGGGATAVYLNDYVELFNPTASAVSLTGWTVQYQASGTTGNWTGKVPLSGTIAPNRYFLVQMSSSSGSGAGAIALPTPDVTSTLVSMSATAAKVSLTNSTTTLITAVGPPVVCPSGGAVLDLVGYGAANCAEGTVTAAPAATTAVFRAGGGCIDTNNNSADFTVAAPLPRNSASAANVCAGSTNPGATGTATSAAPGGTTTISATVTPGTNPSAAITAVTCNLASIGGSTAFALAGSGVSFSSNYTVPAGTIPNTYPLACTVTDGQSRTGNFSISLLVLSSTPPTGAGSATPNPVTLGSSTLLKVAVTPGANPASTGIAVKVDLSGIGGSATQTFFDDGTNGDATAGDNIFSFNATAGIVGPKTLPVTITDAQSRTGAASIALTVNPVTTPPSGTGSANPNSLQPGASTLLTVTVTPGTSPASTGLAVTADLSSIGGSPAQTLFDNGTNGDVTAGDNLFSYNATVAGGTGPGLKSLPATITETNALTPARTGSTTIALTVQSPPAPHTLKISQVYGGGGNSGATYKNDFIEIFNESNSSVDISLWSVQQASATFTGAWSVTPLCPVGTCIVQPYRYFLVWEGPGAGGTTDLPTADVTGTLSLGAASGKVALVNNTTPISGNCPSSTNIADLVGYGSTCFEVPLGGGGASVPALDNLTAAVRKGNGCVDTDNNSTDFVTIGPIPRNSSAPANVCGGDPTKPSGVGTATPSTLEATAFTLLTVAVTPAASPASTGITVTGDLTSLGGSAAQPFYDDGTHGDLVAGDNFFSVAAPVPSTTGAKYIPTTIADAQGRTAPAPITITVSSPTCGVERWSVKTGTDPDAMNGLVNLNNPVRTTITALRGIPAPIDPPGPPLNARLQPTETTVWVVNGVISLFKLETDVDYHIVLKDLAGNTMVTEIPSPACDGTTSPFDAAVAAVRAKFDARFTATPDFQAVNVPVQMKGVGFFDFIHGQTGVAPNGIELHPILDINFTSISATTLSSNASPAILGQPVTFTAAVTSGGGAATGSVSFFDGAALLGTGALGVGGQATLTTSGLAIGTHSITAYYDGDSQIAQSTSSVLTQSVKSVPVITWSNPADITYGGAIGSSQLNATASVPGSFAYTPPAGSVLPVGNGQTLSVTFTPTSSDFTTVSKSVSINVLPASGGGSPPNPLVTKSLARVGGQIVVTLTISNAGGTTAQNVTISAAKIGTVNGAPLPQSIGDIAAGASVQATITFPGTVGTAGAGSSLTVSGTFTGGTFSNTSRITLP